MNINEIEPKVDSAEKLAAVANVPASEVLFAPEINAIVDGVKRLDVAPKQVVLYNQLNNSNGVGNTNAPVIVWTYFAPPDSLPQNCSLQFLMRALCTVGTNRSIMLQLSVSQNQNEIGQLVAIAHHFLVFTQATCILKRTIIIENGFLKRSWNPTQSFASDETNNLPLMLLNTPFDTTKDNYFNFIIQVEEAFSSSVELKHAQIILTPRVNQF